MKSDSALKADFDNAPQVNALCRVRMLTLTKCPSHCYLPFLDCNGCFGECRLGISKSAPAALPAFTRPCQTSASARGCVKTPLSHVFRGPLRCACRIMQWLLSPSQICSYVLGEQLRENDRSFERVEHKTIDTRCGRLPLTSHVQRGHVVPNKEPGQEFRMDAGAEVQPGLAVIDGGLTDPVGDGLRGDAELTRELTPKCGSNVLCWTALETLPRCFTHSR